MFGSCAVQRKEVRMLCKNIPRKGNMYQYVEKYVDHTLKTQCVNRWTISALIARWAICGSNLWNFHLGSAIRNMHKHVSLRILYLYVSFCFWRIFTYLYVPFKTVPEDTYVSLRIFMYLSKPFRKIRMYLYVSLCIFQNRSGRYVCIFTYLYVSFQPVSKDT